MPACSDASTDRLRIVIRKGKTFALVLRSGTSRIAYRNITGVSQAGPCVVTAPLHGLVDGWPFRIANVAGMTEINSDERAMAPDGGWFIPTILTPDTIEINAVNSAGYSAYKSGGQIYYHTPLEMAGYSARMQVRSDAASPDILLDLSTTNSGIVLDNTAKTITLKMTDAATAAIDWTQGVADIELVSGSGQVSLLAPADVLIEEEVTRA